MGRSIVASKLDLLAEFGQYSAMTKRKRALFTWTVAAVMVVLLILFFNRSREPFSYLGQKVKDLGGDKDRIEAFVRDEIKFEDYQGDFRGALGTLWGGSGNELDQAILLQALLSRAEVDSKIMTWNGRYWVRESGTGNDIFPAGQALSETSGKETEFVPDNHFTIELISDPGSGSKPLSFSGRVPQFLRRPLRISIVGKEAKLLQRETEPLLSLPVGKAKRLICRITFHLAGGASKTVRREIFRSSTVGPPSDSEHFITFAPCRLPEWVYQKQTELLRADLGSEEEMERAYELTMAHWYRSDLALADLRKYFSTTAFCVVPRILIGSVYKADEDKSAAGYALDLRLNGVFVDGAEETRSYFNITRSALEAELEAKVMEEAFDMPVKSGLEVFLNHMNFVSPSSAKRVSDYREMFISFLKDSVSGERLHISLKGKDQWLELTHSKKGNALEVKLSRELERTRRKVRNLPWNQLGGESSVGAEGFEELAWELESLLGSASDEGVDYVPEVEILEGKELVITPNVRKFTYRTDKETGDRTVSFETQFRQFGKDGSYSYEVVDHWDEIKKQPQLLQRNYTVSADCAESGKGVSTWHNQSALDQYGCNAVAFSRKMYSELKNQGWTEVIGYGRGMKPIDPMKFYLIEKARRKYRVNNQEIPLSILKVGGGFSKDHLKRPRSFDAVELIKDPSPEYSGTMNEYTILDNEALPLVLGGDENFQTKIPGRVVSDLDGAGIHGAKIEVLGTNSVNLSWPTGIFVLPIIQKPFDEFKVRVTHPDFEPWEELIDFRKMESFEKLANITLKPMVRDDAFVWVAAANLDSDLDKVKNPTTRDLVKMELEDNSSLLALVPAGEVPFGMSSREQAWVLFDRENYQMTFVTSEGLHGVVGSAGRAARKSQTTALSAYSGYVSSWYVYSAGRLEALSNEMEGASYSDLGHGHAIAFARKFLEGMLQRMDNLLVQQGGLNSDAYKAGFLKGLEFFESHPGYSGK